MMNFRLSAMLVLFWMLLATTAINAQAPATQVTEADPFASFSRSWCDRPSWIHRTEVATYQRAKVKDSVALATIVTQKVMADPVTKNRAADPAAPGLREAIQQTTAEIGTADRASAPLRSLVFVGASDFKSLRIDISAGLTFKQFINHKGTLEWHQFSAEPGDSHRTGKYSPPKNLLYENAIPAVLRGFPFAGTTKSFDVALLPNQSTKSLTPAEPVPATVKYIGREEITVPMGKCDTHHVMVTWEQSGKIIQRNFWFSADEALMNVMVRGEMADRETYELKTLETELDP